MAIKRPRPPLAPGRQRGMALLVVLLILAVMVIVASNMSGRLQLELRRTANLTLGKQAWWYAMSAEALVIKVLNQDFKDDPDRVSLGQNWAREDGVFPVEDGTLSGRVRDLQSCFNLNSLSVPLKEGENGDDLEAQPYQFKVFRALLAQLEVDDYEAVQLTDAIRDWTDKDTQLVSSNGAEDAYYEGLNPPYLVANQRMLGTDELRAVRGVSAKIYARLEPWVCVLPSTDPVKLNVNTLAAGQAPLVAMLWPGEIDLATARAALAARPAGGYGSSVRFWEGRAFAGREPPQDVAEQAGVNSRWLALTTNVTIGDGVLTARSLIDANGGAASAGQAAPTIVRRDWGETD